MSRKSRSIAINVDWWPPLLVIFIMVSLWAMLVYRNVDDDRAAIQDSLVSQHNVAQALTFHTGQMLDRIRYLGRKLVKADKDEAASLGLSGTPSFVINGRMVKGAQPAANFKAVIDDELAAK